MQDLATLISAVALAAVAAPAFADEARFVNNEIGYEIVVSPSTVTRESVIADLRRAQSNGELARSYEFEAPVALAPSTKTRDQVRREAASVDARERRAQNALYGPNA